jgi:RNA polymerase sigma-70 factor, ECF subfamily
MKSTDDTNDLSRTTADSSAPEGDVDRVFERDVLPLAGDLYRRALGYTKNAADAEDLVQETLLCIPGFRQAAWRDLDETYLRAWLLCIMRNTWITNYRVDLRRPAEVLTGAIASGELEPAAARGSSRTSSAEHQALRHVRDPDLVAALLALPKEMRETVYYLSIRGLRCREVAEVMMCRRAPS